MTTSLVFELGAYTQVDKRAANSTHGTKHKDWLIVKTVKDNGKKADLDVYATEVEVKQVAVAAAVLAARRVWWRAHRQDVEEEQM